MHRTFNLLLFTSLLSASLLFTNGTNASAEECRSIYVIGNVREIVDCPADQKFDYCITRTSLVDRSGLLTGRLEFFEDSSRGSKHPDKPSMNLYVGVSKITTQGGVLDLTEYGLFNTESLEFAGLATIIGSTGELAGYTGPVANVGNSEGPVQITGTICKE
jgi:hypothetical protein